MTIHVEKIEWDSQVSHDKYKIELTVIELDYVRACLKFASENMNAWTNPNHIEFAAKCSTIINNALVLNGE